MVEIEMSPAEAAAANAANARLQARIAEKEKQENLKRQVDILQEGVFRLKHPDAVIDTSPATMTGRRRV